MPIAATITYLTVALTTTFLIQLVILARAVKSSTTPGSILTYFIFSCAIGYLVFYGTLLLLPELWPAGGG
ncbi:hypothetical protein [Natrinema salinisoli]|uniref:hypothetical protein n=1 Tax=Natrinema salinisoli TaxID=2878535 RepID=UPI001CF063D3|nr:hypothetical protein [Natrinema salinisoli]